MGLFEAYEVALTRDIKNKAPDGWASAGTWEPFMSDGDSIVWRRKIVRIDIFLIRVSVELFGLILKLSCAGLALWLLWRL